MESQDDKTPAVTEGGWPYWKYERKGDPRTVLVVGPPEGAIVTSPTSTNGYCQLCHDWPACIDLGQRQDPANVAWSESRMGLNTRAPPYRNWFQTHYVDVASEQRAWIHYCLGCYWADASDHQWDTETDMVDEREVVGAGASVLHGTCGPALIHGTLASPSSRSKQKRMKSACEIEQRPKDETIGFRCSRSQAIYP